MSGALARDALGAFAADLRRRGDPALLPFAKRLEGAGGPDRFGRATPFDHPTMAHLAPALAAAQGDAAVLAAARAIAGSVNWYQVYDGPGVDPALARGMLAAQIVGMSGILADHRVRAGFFLLGPGIHYPLHTHGAAEVYYALSGRLTLQHGLEGAPFDLTPGAHSVTPPHRLHSLRTGAGPVLLLYCWIGAVDAPNWWWRRTPGGWRRACWERQPGGAWAQSRDEAVTPEAMAEASG